MYIIYFFLLPLLEFNNLFIYMNKLLNSNNLKYLNSSHEPLIPDYIKLPPKVINIDIGRQLFVDDYLIDSNDKNIKISSNTASKSSKSIILPSSEEGDWAVPNMQSLIYDYYSKEYKMWYKSSESVPTKIAIAKSYDGIHWYKPKIINYNVKCVNECCNNCFKKYESSLKNCDNINIIIGGCQNGKGYGNCTMILDQKETNTDKLFKLVYGHCHDLILMYSKDGINWNKENYNLGWGSGSPWYLSFNPFKSKYIFTFRDNLPHIKKTRTTRYIEIDQLKNKWNKWNNQESYGGAGYKTIKENDPYHYVVADKYDKTKFGTRIPGIYCTHTLAYESLMINLISVYQGDTKIPKVKSVELYLGFSRDGINYTRPKDRTPFIAEDEETKYIIPIGGNLIVKKDLIYLYMFTKIIKKNAIVKVVPTLYTIRRDGFSYLGYIDGGNWKYTGWVLTKLLTTNKSYLFVNYSGKKNPDLYVELLSEKNKVLDGYSKNDCFPIKSDSTKILIKWKNNNTLPDGKKFKIKFYFGGNLYSFWTSNSLDGESNGFIGNGSDDYYSYNDNKIKPKLISFSNIQFIIGDQMYILKLNNCNYIEVYENVYYIKIENQYVAFVKIKDINNKLEEYKIFSFENEYLITDIRLIL